MILISINDIFRYDVPTEFDSKIKMENAVETELEIAIEIAIEIEIKIAVKI